MIFFWILSLIVIITGFPLVPDCKVSHDIDEGQFITSLQVYVPQNKVVNEMKVKLFLSLKTEPEGQDIDELVQVDLKDQEDTKRNFQSNQPIMFSLKYNTFDNIPLVGKVVVNKQTVCKNENVLKLNGYHPETIEKTFDFSNIMITTKIGQGSKPLPSGVLEQSNWSEAGCGNFKHTDGFIGNTAEKKDHKRWPWVTAIHSSEELLCSGTFISNSRIVTAAHCIKTTLAAEDLLIKLPKSSGDELSEVNYFERHPKYQKGPEYDIAFVDIDPIEDPEFVPICLTDTQNPAFDGRSGSVLSWAADGEFEDEDDPELKGANFVVNPKENCNKNGQELPNNSFCVGRSDGGAWLCHGDSGAGFMVKHKTQNYLLGVVSAVLSEGDKCDEEDTVIFTDVTKMMSFITKRL